MRVHTREDQVLENDMRVLIAKSGVFDSMWSLMCLLTKRTRMTSECRASVECSLNRRIQRAHIFEVTSLLVRWVSVEMLKGALRRILRTFLKSGLSSAKRIGFMEALM